MRNKSIIKGLLLGLCSLAIFPAAAADDPTVNRMLAAQCAQCHGTEGQAVGDMDGLADEGFKDLYEDMMDMRSEDRPGDIMDHQALGYTEDQIRRIATYYASVSGKDGESNEGDEEQEYEEEYEEENSEQKKKEKEREKEKKKKEKELKKKAKEREKERKEKDD
jgi:cytochrome c553